MTRPAITIDASATLEDAARRMAGAGISGLPVIGAGGRLVGVLSRKDVWRLLESEAGSEVPRGLLDFLLRSDGTGSASTTDAARRVLGRTLVRSAMSRPAISVAPSTHLDDAIGLLISRRVNRLPVLENGTVVGIVTRHDLLAGLTKHRESADASAA